MTEKIGGMPGVATVIFLPCAEAGALASKVASSIPLAANVMVLRIMESSL